MKITANQNLQNPVIRHLVFPGQGCRFNLTPGTWTEECGWFVWFVLFCMGCMFGFCFCFVSTRPVFWSLLNEDPCEWVNLPQLGCKNRFFERAARLYVAALVWLLQVHALAFACCYYALRYFLIIFKLWPMHMQEVLFSVTLSDVAYSCDLTVRFIQR